jgi:hypothetical protein
LRRFLLAQDIERYARLLAQETDPDLRGILFEHLARARREWALLIASESGVRIGSGPSACSADPTHRLPRLFREAFETSAHALLLVEPGPRLRIVDINSACASATLCDPNAVVGKRLFEAFPDNPETTTADSVANLFSVMKAAAETGRPQELRSQPYDVRAGDGRFVRKVWRSKTIPIFDEAHRLAYLLNQVEDITRPGVPRASRAWPRP